MAEQEAARTLTLERLQEIERKVQLGDAQAAHPEKAKLPDGSTLGDLRERQAKQAQKDIREAREFDARSAEANRTTPLKVEASVTPSGVILTSFVAPNTPEGLTEEEEIAQRGDAVLERQADALVAATVPPVEPKKEAKK